jgi:hypothetical protein
MSSKIFTTNRKQIVKNGPSRRDFVKTVEAGSVGWQEFQCGCDADGDGGGKMEAIFRVKRGDSR